MLHSIRLFIFLFLISPVFAQGIGPAPNSGSSIPSGPAGGVLGGTYPNPSFAATTGSGSTVLATSPTLTTPNIGVATATSINGNSITSGTGVLTLGAGKTLTASNSITFTATDGSTLAIGAGGTLGSNAFTSTAYAPLASLAAVATSGSATDLGTGTLNAARLPAFGSGDVSFATAGGAGTIANAAVTNAKSANMNNSTIKCRTTAGAGVPEDCTAAQAASIVNGGVAIGAPYFFADLTSNQSLSSGVTTTVAYAHVVLDSGAYFDTTNHYYKPLVAGTYFVCASVLPNGTFTFAADSGILFLSKTGKEGSGGTRINLIIAAIPTVTGDANTITGCGILTLNGSTDTIEVDVNFTGTSPIAKGAAGTLQTTFYGYRIGP